MNKNIKKYLEMIQDNSVSLLIGLNNDEILLDAVVFWETPPSDLYLYKIIFFQHLKEKKMAFLSILKKARTQLSLEEYNIIDAELRIKLLRIEFLEKIYDTVAYKYDNTYKKEQEFHDYDFYNKLFFGVTQDDIQEKYVFQETWDYNIYFSKTELESMIEYSNSCFPDMIFDIWGYGSMSHKWWVLMIPDKQKYSIREIITLFFHETTHFFRFYGSVKNLGFSYTFSDYATLEEWFALYNEYYYGQKILPDLKYQFYYDECYRIILSDITEEEKQEQIYRILKLKWFDREKSLYYYHRFYRFTSIGSKNLFLKDLIYSSWYNKVQELIWEDKKNYNKILAAKVGVYSLHFTSWMLKKIPAKKYYTLMLKHIQEKIQNT